MKSRKKTMLVFIFIGLLILCAFRIIPKVHLSSENGHNVDVSYMDGQVAADKLIITVNYASYGEFFEIGRDITVATDSEFQNVLRLRGCRVEGENYIYEFDAKGLSDLNTVYVKPPILYIPTEITPVSVPVICGKTAILAGDESADSADENWFTIDTVNVSEMSTGFYDVIITAAADGEDLPRFPKLVCGDVQIGGTAGTYFDENDSFEYAEFQFSVTAASEADAAKMVESSVLEVCEALVKVEAKDLSISSDIESLTIVIADPL